MGHGVSKASLEAQARVLKTQETLRDLLAQAAAEASESPHDFVREEQQDRRTGAGDTVRSVKVPAGRPPMLRRLSEQLEQDRAWKMGHGRQQVTAINKARRARFSSAMPPNQHEHPKRRSNSGFEVEPDKQLLDLGKGKVSRAVFAFPEFEVKAIERVSAGLLRHQEMFEAHQTGVPANNQEQPEPGTARRRLVGPKDESSSNEPGLNDGDSACEPGLDDGDSTHESGLTQEQHPEQNDAINPAVEATKDIEDRINTCKLILDGIAGRWRALAAKKVKPSKAKIGKLMLRPLLQDMMFLEKTQSQQFSTLETVVRTRIPAFVELYLSMYAERYRTAEKRRARKRREDILIDFMVSNGTTCQDAVTALYNSGWDPIMAFKLHNGKPVRPVAPQVSSPVGVLARLYGALKNMDNEELTLVIPESSDVDIKLALIASLQFPKLDLGMVKQLTSLVESDVEAMRNLLLLCVSKQDFPKTKTLLSALERSLPRRVKQEALLLATKRGNVDIFQLFFCFSDEETLAKCFIAAVTGDQVVLIRRLMYVVPSHVIEQVFGTLFRPPKGMSREAWRICENWKDRERHRLCRRAQAGEVADFLHVEHLVSALATLHNIFLAGRVVADLDCGAGSGILAALLCQPFRKVWGFSPDSEEYKVAFQRTQQYLVDFEDVFDDIDGDESDSDSEESSGHRCSGGPDAPEVCLHPTTFALNDRWASEASLVLATRSVKLCHEHVEALRPGCVVAVFRPGCVNDGCNVVPLEDQLHFKPLNLDRTGGSWNKVWHVFAKEKNDEGDQVCLSKTSTL